MPTPPIAVMVSFLQHGWEASWSRRVHRPLSGPALREGRQGRPPRAPGSKGPPKSQIAMHMHLPAAGTNLGATPLEQQEVSTRSYG
jgi:hypothetical protein